MRLIDADSYCENICRCNKERCDKGKCPIHNAPTIEAAPVVYGEWILVSQWKDEDGVINPIYRCSACHIPNDEEDRFCKHCGADMRKGGAE